MWLQRRRYKHLWCIKPIKMFIYCRCWRCFYSLIPKVLNFIRQAMRRVEDKICLLKKFYKVPKTTTFFLYFLATNTTTNDTKWHKKKKIKHTTNKWTHPFLVYFHLFHSLTKFIWWVSYFRMSRVRAVVVFRWDTTNVWLLLLVFLTYHGHTARDKEIQMKV